LVVSGNIIFPALAAAYAAPLLLPFVLPVALFLEGVAARRVEPESRQGWIWATVVAANLWSWLVGVVLTGWSVLPSGLITEDGRVTQGPAYAALACASFLLAWALSTGLEFGLFYPLRKKLRIRKPFKVALLANTYSYAAIVLILVAVQGLSIALR
jgi:hypothetical protein